MKMANEKLNYYISTIERALGIIEGVSYGVDSKYQDVLTTAISMIDESLKEVLEDVNS